MAESPHLHHLGLGSVAKQVLSGNVRAETSRGGKAYGRLSGDDERNAEDEPAAIQIVGKPTKHTSRYPLDSPA
jgi:hypothetical protein